MRLTRKTPSSAAIVLAVLALTLTTACAAEPAAPEGSPSSATASSPAASPGSSSPLPEVFAYPDTSDPTQVAVYLKYEGNDPSGEVIAGPAALVADEPFTVASQCEGDSASFEVVTADADKEVLASGEFACADAQTTWSSHTAGYSGPVQVNMVDAEGLGRGWVRVTQP